MQRFNSVNPQIAEDRTRRLLNAVEESLGVIPNTAKVMANSPTVMGSVPRVAALSACVLD